MSLCPITPDYVEGRSNKRDRKRVTRPNQSVVLAFRQNLVFYIYSVERDKKIDKQTDRQTHRQTDRQAGRQADG